MSAVTVHRPANGGKKATRRKVQTQPAKSAERISDDDADTPSDENKTRSASSSSEDESSGNDDGSSSGSSDESENSSDEAAEETPATASTQTTATRTTPQLRATFEPPSGFRLASDERSSKTISQLLNQSRLAGKQVWYFTAPSSLPVTSMSQTSIQEVEEGSPILTHDDGQYGFSEESGSNSIQLLHSGSEGRYTIAAGQIDRVFHLRRLLRLPTLPQNDRSRSTRAPRTQPRGLRMRYMPAGFGDGDPGTIGSSDTEDEPLQQTSRDGARPTFRQPDNDGDRSDQDEEMPDAEPAGRDNGNMSQSQSSLGKATKKSTNAVGDRENRKAKKSKERRGPADHESSRKKKLKSKE